MDFVLTIIRIELARLRGQPSFYGKRLLLPLAAGLIVLGGTYQGANRQISTMGLVILSTLSYLAAAVACLLPCCSASGVFARGRETRTLELLIAADASIPHLVLGHVLAAIFWAAITVLSVLPMVILCVGLGGVTTGQIVQVFLILLTTLILSTCLGLLVSVLSPNARSAFSWAFFAAVLVFGLLPGGLLFWTQEHQGTSSAAIAAELLPILSPFKALELLFKGQLPWSAVRFHLLSLGLAGLFLPATIRLFPRMALARPSSRRVRHSRKGIRVFLDNPLADREGPGSMLRMWTLCVGSVAGVALFNSYVLQSRVYPEVTALWTCAALFAAPFLLRCCRITATERSAGTLEPLLLSDLSPDEIIVGKLWAALQTFSPWLIGLCAMAVFLGLVDRGAWWSAHFLCAYILCLCSYTVIILCFAIPGNSLVALLIASLALVGWPLGADELLHATDAADLTVFFFVGSHVLLAAIAFSTMQDQIAALGNAPKKCRSPSP